MTAIAGHAAHADLINDPDGILGTLHIDGSPVNAFPGGPVFVGAGPEFTFDGPDFGVEVDLMDEMLWITQVQNSANPGLPWEIWLEDLDWGVPGEITDILVPMMPPFMTTFTANSIHITYTPAQQNPPPGPGVVIEYHTGFLVRHVPEPGTLALGLLGLGAVRFLGRRGRDRHANRGGPRRSP